MTTISPPPAVLPSNRRGALALVLPLLVVAGCLLFYAGLVPLGYWQGDEFLTIRSIEEYGLSSLTWRLTTWSPRPISEGLLYSYMTLVLSSGRQLIAPMLGVLWCLLGLAIILPAALARRFNATSIIASIIVFGGVLAQPLSSRFTYDVFYWIQGAAAYVPTIAAFIAVLGLIIFGSTRSNPIRISVAIILCGAAMASEVGAFFVLIFTSLTFVLHIIQRLFNGKPDRTRSSYIYIYILPLFVSFIIIAYIYFGRLGEPLEAWNDLGTAHRIIPSFVATLKLLPLDLVGHRNNLGQGTWVSTALLPKLLLFLGTVLVLSSLVFRGNGWDRLLLIAFGTAAIATAFLTLFAGYYQFGNPCCLRHEVMRELLSTLSLVAFGAVVAASLQYVATSTFRLGIGGSMIALASVLVVQAEAPRVQASYARYDQARNTMAWNWLAAHEPGPSMSYRLRGDAYAGEDGWTAGTYRSDQSDLPVPIRHMMEFFKKERVDVLPPLPTP